MSSVAFRTAGPVTVAALDVRAGAASLLRLESYSVSASATGALLVASCTPSNRHTYTRMVLADARRALRDWEAGPG